MRETNIGGRALCITFTATNTTSTLPPSAEVADPTHFLPFRSTVLYDLRTVGIPYNPCYKPDTVEYYKDWAHLTVYQKYNFTFSTLNEVRLATFKAA
jgi:hypothetical protein